MGWGELRCLYVEEALRGEEGWLGEGTQRRPVCGDRRKESCCVGGAHGMQCTATREEYVGCSEPPRIIYCSGSTTCRMGSGHCMEPILRVTECTGGCKSGRDQSAEGALSPAEILVLNNTFPPGHVENSRQAMLKIPAKFCFRKKYL